MGKAVAATMVLSALAPLPAHADFLVCNDTFDVVSLAVGVESDDGDFSEGWWVVAASRCARVLRGGIDGLNVHVYATDIFNRPVLEPAPGNRTGDFCVSETRFRIPDRDECWLRGYIAAPFVRIGTDEAPHGILILE
ncbi:MAG: DUF1036 domain-containing protein [Pararhodobacter sp.]